MNEYFRGIVWPKDATNSAAGKNYRYVVVGVLVTDEPLVFEDVKHDEVTEALIDGSVSGMAEVLEAAPRRVPAQKVGDANMVLMSLADL